MRIIVALLASVVFTLAATSAFAQTCDFSGAPVGPSESAMKVRVRGEDGVLRTHWFGGPAHAFYYINDVYGDSPDVHSAFITDYSTGAEVNAMNAWFLAGTRVAPSGTTADPPVIGFADRTAAEAAQARLGGELVQGWNGVWGWIAEGYESGYEGDRRSHYGLQQ